MSDLMEALISYNNLIAFLCNEIKECKEVTAFNNNSNKTKINPFTSITNVHIL